MDFPKKLFVTGTNTDIGKTFVSGVLMAGLGAHYWKPIQSGSLESTDTQWLSENTGLDKNHFFEETYRFEHALSPHAAAKLENIEISLDKLGLPELAGSQTLIVEGAGGLMVPLNDELFMLDLIRKLNIPVVIVADSGLGTINHTMLTIEQLKRHDIEIFGVVMNGVRNRSNRQAIEKYGRVPVLAEVEPLKQISPVSLKNCFDRCFTRSQ